MMPAYVSDSSTWGSEETAVEGEVEVGGAGVFRMRREERLS